MLPSPPILARRAVLAVLSGLTFAPWWVGCARPQRPLAIASHLWPGYLSMFLARDEGWLPPGIELRKTASPSESMRLIEEGEVLAAALTLDEVLRLRAAGLPLAVTLVFNISSGADMVLGRATVRTLADLRGKRIGVEVGALGALMLAKTLEAAKMTTWDVIVVPLTIDVHERAWQDGLVDALISYEPVAGKLLRQNAHLLFDSRALPNLILDVLAIRPEASSEHEEALRALIAAHFRALDYLRSHRHDAGYRLAGYLGSDGGKALDAFRGIFLPDAAANRRLLAGPVPELLRAAAQLSAAMVDHQLLSAPASLTGLTRADYLPKL